MTDEREAMRWLEGKHEYFEKFLEANKELCIKCREHCDEARKICEPRIQALMKEVARLTEAADTRAKAQEDIFNRMRTLELKTAGIAKAPFVAGACTIAAAILAHYLKLL